MEKSIDLWVDATFGLANRRQGPVRSRRRGSALATNMMYNIIAATTRVTIGRPPACRGSLHSIVHGVVKQVFSSSSNVETLAFFTKMDKVSSFFAAGGPVFKPND